MKNVFNLILFVSISALLSSCVLEQNIHFNKDLSGNYNLKLDMSSFMAMAGDSAQTDETQISAEDFKEMEDNIRGVDGISQLKSTAEEGVYTLEYKFKDVESLTKAGTQNTSETGGAMQFSRKGNNLVLDMKPPAKGEEEMSASDMESMEGMFTFKYSFSFDKPIAKLKSKTATLDKETNTVKFEFGLKEYFDPKTQWKTQVIFKK